jgi:NOL1/NOP2/fmu family ribosome biogenesis protein
LSFAWLDPEQSRRAVAYLEGVFGIPPEVWAGHRFLLRGEYVYAVAREAAGACDAFHWVGAGLRILKAVAAGKFKPTSSGVQVFGRWATRRVRDLADHELRALLSGQSLPEVGAEEGPVILRWQGISLGMGFVRGGQLVSQVPRAVTEHLRMR